MSSRPKTWPFASTSAFSRRRQHPQCHPIDCARTCVATDLPHKKSRSLREAVHYEKQGVIDVLQLEDTFASEDAFAVGFASPINHYEKLFITTTVETCINQA